VVPPVATTPGVTAQVALAAETPQVQETGQGTLTSSPLIQNSVGRVPGVLAGLNLTVIDTGVRMPLVQAAVTPPVEVAPVIVAPVTPPAVVVPPVAPPPIYVPPQRPRKPDRN
jgi:hypothetical protein